MVARKPRRKPVTTWHQASWVRCTGETYPNSLVVVRLSLAYEVALPSADTAAFPQAGAEPMGPRLRSRDASPYGCGLGLVKFAAVA